MCNVLYNLSVQTDVQQCNHNICLDNWALCPFCTMMLVPYIEATPISMDCTKFLLLLAIADLVPGFQLMLPFRKLSDFIYLDKTSCPFIEYSLSSITTL